MAAKFMICINFVGNAKHINSKIVQINDKGMKIGIQGNFGMLISKQLRHTLNFVKEGCNLQSKMADIEIFHLRYNLRFSAGERAFMKQMIFS